MKDWDKILAPIKASSPIAQLKQFITERREVSTVYPSPANLFKPFNLCPYEKLKVVIIGDYPYAQKDVADGLAFSTPKTDTPFELKQIFEEVHNNLYSYVTKEEHKYLFPSNDLSSWAKQGVLLLNYTMTCEENKPEVHKDRGWAYFVESVVKSLNKYPEPLVFMLWGDEARKLKLMINTNRTIPHLVLEAGNPSTEANKGKGTFLGCKHFLKAHEFLIENRTDIVPQQIDMNPYIDLDNVLSNCKKLIKTNRYPLPEPKERINIVHQAFVDHFNMNITVPINYTT